MARIAQLEEQMTETARVGVCLACLLKIFSFLKKKEEVVMWQTMAR